MAWLVADANAFPRHQRSELSDLSSDKQEDRAGGDGWQPGAGEVGIS